MFYKYIILFLSITTSNLVFAQDSLVCTSSRAIVSNLKLNVLYTDVENPLLISLAGYKTFIVKIDEGTITKGDDGYIARVNKVGKNEIHLLDNKGKEIENFQFRVKNIPKPIVELDGGFRSGVIAKRELLSKSALITVLENFDFEVFFKIISFKVSVIQENNVVKEFTTTGNQLPLELRDFIKETDKETKLYFYQIKGKIISGNENASNYDLDDIYFTVRE